MPPARPGTADQPSPEPPGTFVVQELPRVNWLHRWEWVVTGYDAHGRLLLQTVHATTSSKDVEVAAWKRRGFTERQAGG